MWHSVIMAGGSGTRFWPQSRRKLPKQFLRFSGEHTLLQGTAQRCDGIIPNERTWIVTGREHVAETTRQLPMQVASQILVEPCGRSTAPCIGLAAIHLLAADPDAAMLVMPADHVIRPAAEFQRGVERAIAVIDQAPDALVLFGIPPTFPATGFGYIHRGAALSESTMAFRVAAFREKPAADVAAGYVSCGEYFWNAGIFAWRADTILGQLTQHAPDIAARLDALRPTIGTADYSRALETEFPAMPAISIDYAVLERASNVCVVPATFDWDDVGSWSALPRLLPADANGNTADGPFCGVNTSGCIIRSPAEHLIATFGVRDLVIVHTPTATLVADKNDDNALRQLISELLRQGFSEFL